MCIPTFYSPSLLLIPLTNLPPGQDRFSLLMKSTLYTSLQKYHIVTGKKITVLRVYFCCDREKYYCC
jgi:hypothetical protein